MASSNELGLGPDPFCAVPKTPDFRQYSGSGMLHGLAGELSPEEREQYEQQRRLFAEMQQAGEQRAKLWELYKIAIPMTPDHDQLHHMADAAMETAKAFLARWKAETEAPADDPRAGDQRAYEEHARALAGFDRREPGGQPADRWKEPGQ